MNDVKPDVANLPAILRDRAKVSELRGHHHAQWSEGVRFAANQIEAAIAKPADGGGLPADDDETLRLLDARKDDALCREAADLIRRLATTAGVLGDTEIAHIAYDFLLAAGYDMDSAPLNKIKAAATTPPPAPAAEQGELTITTDECGHCVAITRQDAEHRITETIWVATPIQPEARGVEGMVHWPKWLHDRCLEALEKVEIQFAATGTRSAPVSETLMLARGLKVAAAPEPVRVDDDRKRIAAEALRDHKENLAHEGKDALAAEQEAPHWGNVPELN